MTRPAALLLTLAIAFLGACATNTAPPAGHGDPVPAPLNDPQISVLDAQLKEWLFFHPAAIVHEDRVMRVEIPMRNRAPRNYALQYRILFYDANGLELTPVMGWQLQEVDPNQIVRLKANSLDDRAENYRLEVRWAK